MAKSSLKIGETSEIDQGINPYNRQTSNLTLEEMLTKFSVKQ